MTNAIADRRDDATGYTSDGITSTPPDYRAGEESSTMTSDLLVAGTPYGCGVHAELLSTNPNPNHIKGDVLNMKTVKEMKAEAKAMGIKGYSKMNKEELIVALASASVASEPKASEPHPVIVDQDQPAGPVISDSDDDFFDADDIEDAEPVAAYVKRIEFVKGTNLAVQFKFNGKMVIIGWSKNDFKMHSWSEISGRSMLTSYATQMKFFKKLKNGLDGDVAQVVKALVRIKAMPAEIKVLQRKASRSDEQNVSGRRVDENGRIRRGVVDVNVMNVFVGMYAEAMQTAEADVRKNGRLIREFMNEYAALEDETSVEVFAASYIADIYSELNASEEA